MNDMSKFAQDLINKRIALETHYELILKTIVEVAQSGGSWLNIINEYPEITDRLTKLGYDVTVGNSWVLICWFDNKETDDENIKYKFEDFLKFCKEIQFSATLMRRISIEWQMQDVLERMGLATLRHISEIIICNLLYPEVEKVVKEYGGKATLDYDLNCTHIFLDDFCECPLEEEWW